MTIFSIESLLQHMKQACMRFQARWKTPISSTRHRVQKSLKETGYHLLMTKESLIKNVSIFVL